MRLKLVLKSLQTLTALSKKYGYKLSALLKAGRFYFGYSLIYMQKAAISRCFFLFFAIFYIFFNCLKCLVAYDMLDFAGVNGGGFLIHTETYKKL